MSDQRGQEPWLIPQDLYDELMALPPEADVSHLIEFVPAGEAGPGGAVPATDEEEAGRDGDGEK